MLYLGMRRLRQPKRLVFNDDALVVVTLFQSVLKIKKQKILTISHFGVYFVDALGMNGLDGEGSPGAAGRGARPLKNGHIKITGEPQLALAA